MGLQDGYQERQLNQMAHQEQLHPGQLIDGTVDVNSTVTGIHNALLDKWPSGQIDTTTGYLTVVNYRQAGTGAAPITDAQLVDSGDAYQGNFKVALTVDVGAEGSGSTAGKIDFFLNFGSGSAGINGYMFEIDYTSGDYAGTIYRVDNGVLTNIGTQKQAVNAAQLNGWKHATIQYHATGTAAGKMALYVAGHLQAIALDTTYTGTYLLSYAAYGAEGYIRRAAITAQHELPADTFDPNLRPYIDLSQSGHLNKILDNIADGTTYKRVANVSASNLITTASVTPAAINNIAIAENTSSQTVTTTVVSGTTPPTAPSTWTQVASVALTVASSTDYIRLQSLVAMTLTNFFLCASNYALKGSTPTTVVYDQIWARIRETTTDTIVWQTTSGQYFGKYTQIYNGSSFWYASNMACGLDGPIAGVPGSKLITGLSGSLNFVLEIGATDMTKQYVSGSALSVTVTDAYIEAWDIQR